MTNLCVIPFYNEERRINLIQLKLIFSQNREMSFLLLNDGSTDNTLLLLNQLGAEYVNVKVISNEKNMGKAESIRNAFMLSLDDNYDYVGFIDSDFATPFDQYLYLLNSIMRSDYSIIIGSRVKLHGFNIVRNPYRHFFSRILVTLINLMFNLSIYDTQCGCKVFRSDIISEIFKSKFRTKWLFDIEICLRFFKRHDPVNLLELPIKGWREIKGSKIKLLDFLSVPYNVLKLFYIYKVKNQH